jgi:hypothetical protein
LAYAGCRPVEAVVTVITLPGSTRRPFGSDHLDWWGPTLIATGLAVLAGALGWRGVDLAAQVYRVGLFHRSGLVLWDSQWYGGHWTPNYSVLFPPLAGLLGVRLTAVAGATLASWSFDRLVRAHFGTAGRAGALLFAIGTVVQVAIGQLPFLLGEALGLCAVLTARRGRWRLAGVLAATTALLSPVSGAFLALGALAWVLGTWPARPRAAVAMLAGAGTPLLVVNLLFPTTGSFPFPVADLGWVLGVCAAVLIVIPRHERVLRVGVVLYGLAAVVTFLVPSPLGDNIARLGGCLGVPLLACVLWPHRRMLLLLLGVPISLWQSIPAWGAIATNGRDASTHAAYFAPLLGYLEAHDPPAGRVEVVPTRQHWEAAVVAPQIPLARGWERQLDIANNPMFYSDAPLTAAAYHDWLISNGVRWVALPDVPLDYPAAAEAQLVATNPSGLVPAWQNAHWRVWEVAGSTGIVDGPAHGVVLKADTLNLVAEGLGPITVRVRYTPHWQITRGHACLSKDPAGWMVIHPARVGSLHLRVGLLNGQDSC